MGVFTSLSPHIISRGVNRFFSQKLTFIKVLQHANTFRGPLDILPGKCVSLLGDSTLPHTLVLTFPLNNNLVIPFSHTHTNKLNSVADRRPAAQLTPSVTLMTLYVCVCVSHSNTVKPQALKIRTICNFCIQKQSKYITKTFMV